MLTYNVCSYLVYVHIVVKQVEMHTPYACLDMLLAIAGGNSLNLQCKKQKHAM